MLLLLVEPLKTPSVPTSVHVRIGTLEVLQVEGALWQAVKWVLRFRFLLYKVIILIVFRLYFFLGLLGLWLGGLLWLLLLLRLGRRDILLSFLNKLDLTKDRLNFGLIDDSLKMPGEMRELGTGFGIKVDLEGIHKYGRNVHVSKRDTLPNKECACTEVSVQCAEGACSAFVKDLLKLRAIMSYGDIVTVANQMRTGLL